MEKKSKATVKATEAKKDAALKESFAEIKKAAEPAKEVKKDAPAPVKKEEPKETKKEAAPAKEAKKAAPVKKEAPKKAPAAKKEAKTSVTLQYSGKDVDLDKLVEAAKKAASKVKADAKKVDIYVNVDERAAYFAVDGEGNADYKVEM